MALYATNRFPGDGSTTSYEFNFVGKYIARSHVKVYQEDNATKVRTHVPITDGNFLNDTTLQGLPVTPVDHTLVIYRDTPKPPLVDFVNGARFTEYNMDLVARQGLFVAMEALDAGDSDARDQLLAAITVITDLVNDATTAVSDATVAALAAATSAANASASATVADTAKTAAEAAKTAAEAAKTAAETASTNAQAAVAAAANLQGRMACRVEVTNLANRTLTLQRCGGQTMSINGVSRVIPAEGVSLNVANSATARYLYAYWTGTAIVLTESSVVPTFDTTLGQWVYPGNPNYTPVAYFRGNALNSPERFLRNYYNGPGAYSFTSPLPADYTANWDGAERQILNYPFLSLPGDSLDMRAYTSIMSTPDARVGDFIVKLVGGVVARARNTHRGAAYVWQNYSCHALAPMRPLTSAAAQQLLTLHYLPISTDGSIFTLHGDGITTRLSVNIIPYKFA